jgi:hypothetical protein
MNVQRKTEAFLQWTKNRYHIIWVCICSLKYPACNEFAPLCPVSCPTLQYFSTYFHKRKIFEKSFEHKMFILIFFINYVWGIFYYKKTELDMIKMCIGLQEKYLLLLSDFSGILIFSTYFRKIFKYQISWKSFHWEPSCSIRTDMTRRKIALWNFAEVPKAFCLVWSFSALLHTATVSCVSSCCRVINSYNV